MNDSELRRVGLSTRVGFTYKGQDLVGRVIIKPIYRGYFELTSPSAKRKLGMWTWVQLASGRVHEVNLCNARLVKRGKNANTKIE